MRKSHLIRAALMATTPLQNLFHINRAAPTEPKRRVREPFPTMVTAPRREIAQHNDAVAMRKKEKALRKAVAKANAARGAHHG